MAIQDGQPVNAAYTNTVVLSKNTDDSAFGKLTLANADTASGSSVVNIQRECNALWSFLGGLLNQSKTYLPTWLSNHYGTASDTIKQRVEALDTALFNAGSSSSRSGVVSLSNAIDSVSITFSSAWPDANYVALWSIECSDSNPTFLNGYISTRTVSGLTIKFNGQTDSTNYKLHYSIRGAV